MEINSWKLEDFHGSKSFQGACLPPNFNSTRPLSRSTLQLIMPRNPSLSYLATGDKTKIDRTTDKIRVAGLLDVHESPNPEPKFRLVKGEHSTTIMNIMGLEKKYRWIKMLTILPHFASSNQWKCQDQLWILGHEISPVPRCQQFFQCAMGHQNHALWDQPYIFPVLGMGVLGLLRMQMALMAATFTCTSLAATMHA